MSSFSETLRKLEDRVRKQNLKLSINTIQALFVLLLLFILCFFMGNSQEDITLNLSHFLLGLSLGWGLGFLISPYSKGEEKQYLTYTKAMTIFIAGYLLTKIDRIIEIIIEQEQFMRSHTVFRGMTFLTAAIVAMIATFIHRKYTSTNKVVDEQPESPATIPGSARSVTDVNATSYKNDNAIG